MVDISNKLIFETQLKNWQHSPAQDHKRVAGVNAQIGMT